MTGTLTFINARDRRGTVQPEDPKKKPLTIYFGDDADLHALAPGASVNYESRVSKNGYPYAKFLSAVQLAEEDDLPLKPFSRKEAGEQEDDPYKDYLTVTELNERIRGEFQKSTLFQWVLVKGEVTNCSERRGSYYFSIKDENAVLPCCLFRSYAESALKFELKNGCQTALAGSFEYSLEYGTSRLIVYDIRDLGEGAYQLQLLRLREKLRKEHLFDPQFKKPIPKHAKTIGVVTSKNGQAFHDICTEARKRCPSIRIVLYPVSVQGKAAVRTTIAGLRYLDSYGVDVIIVGRGGGSDEDLKAYNDESLARAIFAARTPVITAIGHTGNHSIADDTADLFTITPTDAAVAAVPNIRETLNAVAALEREMKASVRRRVLQSRHRLSEAGLQRTALARALLEGRKAQIQRLLVALQGHDPRVILQKNREMLRQKNDELQRQIAAQITERKHRFSLLLSDLHGLSPTAKLQGGYGYVEKDGLPLLSVRQVQKNDPLRITIHDGEILTKVTEIIITDEAPKETSN